MKIISAAARSDWSEKDDLRAQVLNTTGAGLGETEGDAGKDRAGEWSRVRTRIRAAVGEEVFTSWFARLELEEIENPLAPQFSKQP